MFRTIILGILLGLIILPVNSLLGVEEVNNVKSSIETANDEALKEGKDIEEKSKTIEGTKEIIKNHYGDDLTKNPESGINFSMAVMGDGDAKKRLIEAINNDSSYSEEKKKQQIEMLEATQAEFKETMAQAKTSDGQTDVNKVRELLTQEKIQANDALAKGTLRTLSTACESFAKINQGSFPVSVEDLIKSNPPYLYTNYCLPKPVSGFTYHCVFGKDGYRFSATPVRIGETGSTSFTMTTGENFKEGNRD